MWSWRQFWWTRRGKGGRGGDGPPGGGVGGPPGVPTPHNQGFTIFYAASVLGGGLDAIFWTCTCGSLNPNDHDYHLVPGATYQTIHCINTMGAENKNHTKVTTRVEGCEKLSNGRDLLLQERFMWVGCQDNGYYSILYY